MPFPPNHCYLWNSRCKSVYFDQTNRNFSMTSLRSPIYCNLQRRYRTCRDFWDFSHFVPSYEVTNEYDMPYFFNEWDRWRPTYLLSYGAYKVTIDLSQSTHWTFLFLTVQHLKTNKKKNSEQITISTASVVTFLVGCVNDPRMAKTWLDELQFYI